MLKQELFVTTGTYQKNGETKKRWKKVGEIHGRDDGSEYIVIDPFVNFAAVPRKEGEDRVYLSAFSPKPKYERDEVF